MSYQLKVLRDYPMAFWPLDETSGSTAYDISGCGNHGTYFGSFTQNLMPLISGGEQGTRLYYALNYIDFPTSKDYYSNESTIPFGTPKTSDKSFTIEFWLKLDCETVSSGPTILKDVGSVDPRMGIEFNRGYLSFYVADQDDNFYTASGYLNYINKTIHVAAIYTVNSILLYVDGSLMQTVSLPNDFKFYGNEDPVTLRAKTDSGATNSYLIDALAIYRYALPYRTIISHYTDGNNQINPYQVASSNNGKFFNLNATQFYETYIYTYPADKDLKSFISDTNIDYIYYDEAKKTLKFYETLEEGQSVVLEDFIMLPDEIGTNSKIEWRGDHNISVEVSVDGENYFECYNGDTIPLYKNSNYDNSGLLYIKITMNSQYSGGRLYGSEFSFLSIVFYREQILYSDNGGGSIQADSYLPSDIVLGTLNYPTLSRHSNNGIKATGGFKTLNTEAIINSIEMFFTPTGTQGEWNNPQPTIDECTLIYSNSSPNQVEFSWDATGTINKNKISKFYVNGIDKSSETDIYNIFIPKQMYHLVLVLEEGSCGSSIYFNYNPETLDYSSGKCLYNNIILYEVSLDGSDIQYNYNLWTGKSNTIIVDNPIAIDEKAIKVDDVDWNVVSSS